jgi:hypothetical protein
VLVDEVFRKSDNHNDDDNDDDIVILFSCKKSFIAENNPFFLTIFKYKSNGRSKKGFLSPEPPVSYPIMPCAIISYHEVNITATSQVQCV